LSKGPAIWAGALAVLLAGLILVPSLRVSAQGFLDLFRVRNFAAVTVDAARLQQLQDMKLDLHSMLGAPQVTKEAGPLRMFQTVSEASAATGYARRPTRSASTARPRSTCASTRTGCAPR
jgi:hypothetical protein